MKIVFAIVTACVVTVFACAQRSPVFAKDGRVVTVEHWNGNAATVWAVQTCRIVVYRIFDTAAPDQLLAEVPITREQCDKIRRCVSAIQKEFRGRVYMPRGVFDGQMLRVSFTPDGRFANDRIEVQNLWLPWLAGVTQTISEALPDEQKIRFKEQINERNRKLNWRADWPTETIAIDKYYEGPNQPAPAQRP